MSKKDVFEVLKKNVLDILEDEVQEGDITIDKSMIDLGANSIDIVQIVSNTMRELKVKVPREELSNLNNMEEFVDKIVEYK
jgi:polyketide biosynthesis acyl carrier protein